MNVLSKTGYIFVFTIWSSLPHSSHTGITLFPSKPPLIFRAVNMTGKREDNSAIPFINLVKAHQLIWNYLSLGFF